ncbi:MAG: LysR family transcriptional regulator [Lachnospiraceae bacterium]|nr:LysR family transcriptional regulator [Lachnospiraceae bacterium]
MNLNQLHYFISLAETLNFTRAAADCFISQTAMTQQIKALETTVGVPLFIRDRHHVELTAAGKVYLKEARAIVARSDDAIRLARLVSEGVEGEVTIGYAKGFGQKDFVRSLRDFHEAYPSIKINLISDNTSILFEELKRGECDVIMTLSPKIRDHQNMKSVYLASYPVMAVLPEAHPLAGRDSLTYRDLENESFIMMEPSGRPLDQMEESLLIYERGGYYPNIVAMEGNPETLMLMISTGLGISIMPEYAVRLYQSDETLRIVPLIKEDGTTENLDFEMDWMEDSINPAVLHLHSVITAARSDN